MIFAVLALLGFPQLTFAQLAVLETAGLRLVYLDPSEKFLVPHAARTFLNSFEFQRKILGFEPREPVTVLLTDFADAGNAGATVLPRNNVTVDIAPLNSAFETIAGNERMNIIMNHELVHLSTMDPPSSGDRAFRKLFGGKVMPVEEQPETILVLPAGDASCRGAAVVSRGNCRVPRYLDGGWTRARSGRIRRDGLPIDGP